MDTAPTNATKTYKTGPILAALIIGAFVSLLTESLLQNALPSLTTVSHVSYTTIQWLLTAYLLVIGVLAPITGLLQQWFTTR
ncbi:hypothetical protein [Secundilactobacillus paracollinoides]|uniref:hypothetical protein n=1 Tax=Secundilactobacillus paracollinoides TaxID=240427 RepID=UPI0006F18288|nr:hypothetical protein [Secundilactobacillus paracollinoides]KRL79278.1 hypothetical protein FC17_GL000543 [Secundilactobacillus paracollinoides DSM 15502 = JCM 11969]